MHQFQVKVALRSVLNELDEETEILPHIKMSKDFEIYEPVTLQPIFSILPWDENTKPTYDIYFKVKISNFTLFLRYIGFHCGYNYLIKY